MYRNIQGYDITTGCAGLGPDGGWRLRPRLCATASFFSTDACLASSPGRLLGCARFIGGGPSPPHATSGVCASAALGFSRAPARRAQAASPRRPSAARRAALASASDESSAPTDPESCAAALGYVTQATLQLASVLDVPLRYPVAPGASRSYICDLQQVPTTTAIGAESGSGAGVKSAKSAAAIRSGGTPPAWHHNVWSLGWDTPYSFDSPEAFNCDLNRGDSGNRIFQINHWVGTSLGLPSEEAAMQVNTKEAVLARVADCHAQWGRLPSWFVVDFVEYGDVYGAVSQLNLQGLP